VGEKQRPCSLRCGLLLRRVWHGDRLVAGLHLRPYGRWVVAMKIYHDGPLCEYGPGWSGDTSGEPDLRGGIPYPDLRCMCIHDDEPEGERECLMCGERYRVEP